MQCAAVFFVFPDMLIDALVTDKGDAILRQTAADLIGTPLLLRQFLLDQLHQVRRHFARLVRGLLASLRGLLVRLLEAIAAGAGVANKLAADRRSAWRRTLSDGEAAKRRAPGANKPMDEVPIHPLRLCDEIKNFMQRDAILVVDGQEILNFGRQSMPTFTPGHRLNSGPFGT